MTPFPGINKYWGTGSKKTGSKQKIDSGQSMMIKKSVAETLAT